MFPHQSITHTDTDCHENIIYSEKPYVCQICDKGFARHATLWNHRRVSKVLYLAQGC